MTVAGPFVTFPFWKLKEKLLAAVRPETLLPQAQQCLIKISGHRLKENNLEVQNQQVFPQYSCYEKYLLICLRSKGDTHQDNIPVLKFSLFLFVI